MPGYPSDLHIPQRGPLVQPTGGFVPKIMKPQIDATGIPRNPAPLVAQAGSRLCQRSLVPVPPRKYQHCFAWVRPVWVNAWDITQPNDLALIIPNVRVHWKFANPRWN